MYNILYNSDPHHKITHAMKKYKRINFVRGNISDDLSKFDAGFFPGTPINVSLYPDFKFIFGPHFSVLPDENKLLPICGPNSVYIQPSQWVVDFWKRYDICSGLNLEELPFGVDTEKFAPNGCERSNVFIYFKHRDPSDLQYIKDTLNRFGIAYRVFEYGYYNEDDYLNFLQTCKYGIWLGAHESQGFALQEALSTDVPLLVWSVTALNQEHGYYYPPGIPATTIPYWNPKCGEVFYNKDEFVLSLQKIMVGSYKPRDFILNNLSIEICENRFIELIVK